MSRRPLSRLAGDRRGGAAVEFALIAPVLAALLAVLISVWGDVTSVVRMRAAVHAGAGYLRAGGADPEMVRTVVVRAWEDMPSGAEVTVAESCACGDAAGGCAVLCPAGDPPLVYVEIRAATGTSEQLIGRTYSAAEVVRVR